ncbi:ADP-ribosyltransferase [Carbonactinospora thermoautotrophica]|uniref:ADP-ribosyltransferase n=1 Tax=Carbonactinospora thermoautotrophica TaxID=1469144 RepID=UPI003DA7C364
MNDFQDLKDRDRPVVHKLIHYYYLAESPLPPISDSDRERARDMAGQWFYYLDPYWDGKDGSPSKEHVMGARRVDANGHLTDEKWINPDFIPRPEWGFRYETVFELPLWRLRAGYYTLGMFAEALAEATELTTLADPTGPRQVRVVTDHTGHPAVRVYTSKRFEPSGPETLRQISGRELLGTFGHREDLTIKFNPGHEMTINITASYLLDFLVDHLAHRARLQKGQASAVSEQPRLFTKPHLIPPPARIWTEEEWSRIQHGYASRSSDEKWNAKMNGNELVFRRSWTGYAIYAAYFEQVSDGWKIRHALVESDPERHVRIADAYDTVMLEHLICAALLGDFDMERWRKLTFIRSMAPFLQEIREEHPEVAHVTDEELLAIKRYTWTEYQEINEPLRTGDMDRLAELTPEIRDVVSGLDKLPDYKGTVYRGVQIDPGDLNDFLNRYEPGATIREPAFPSSDKERPFPGNVQFVIESRHGKDISFLQQHEEVVFPPGTKFKVKTREFDPDTGTWHIHLVDTESGDFSGGSR